jgi:Sorting nexin C terminal
MAVSVKQLADSEAMKRFFGKEITEQSLGKKNKAWQPLKGVSAPLKGVGGGMRDAAEGSQKLLAAAWATTAGKKRASTPVPEKSKLPEITVRDIRDEAPTPEEDTAYHSPLFRESISRSGTLNSQGGEQEVERNSTSSSLNGYTFIGGDEESSKSASSTSLETPSVPSRPPEPEPEPSQATPTVSESISPPPPPSISKSPSPAPQERPSKPAAKSTAPELSANDAQQILDIGFSILSELYALSPRTWMIRKSLLNLLKSLLISNGRTYIDTIRTMLQEDLINKCLASDDWLASQVKAVTESMFPSVPVAAIDDAAYKVQAKELFMNKMLPETMRGLMGGAATSQALEVVFEALQDQRVAKGILVALMCDIIRALQV